MLIQQIAIGNGGKQSKPEAFERTSAFKQRMWIVQCHDLCGMLSSVTLLDNKQP